MLVKYSAVSPTVNIVNPAFKLQHCNANNFSLVITSDHNIIQISGLVTYTYSIAD